MLDTTGASVKGRVIADGVGLKANLGPLGVALGTEVVDTDYADVSLIRTRRIRPPTRAQAW